MNRDTQRYRDTDTTSDLSVIHPLGKMNRDTQRYRDTDTTSDLSVIHPLGKMNRDTQRYREQILPQISLYIDIYIHGDFKTPSPSWFRIRFVVKQESNKLQYLMNLT
jgi:hypothetical protein